MNINMILFYIVLSLSASNALEIYTMENLMTDLGVEEERRERIMASMEKMLKFNFDGVVELIDEISLSDLENLIPDERTMKSAADTVSKKVIEIYNLIINKTPGHRDELNVMAPGRT